MLRAVFFSLSFGAGLAFPNTQDACAIHRSEAQAADDCAGANCTIHLLLADGGFDPALCNITGATLSVDVKGEYGSSSEYDGKVEVVLHDAHTSSDSGTIIDSGDIACVNDGTCKSDWDSCLENYKLTPSIFQNLTDRYVSVGHPHLESLCERALASSSPLPQRIILTSCESLAYS